ncbi:hypothetical protein [Nostoc favosum]|uniref:hypothetical protein n=1 Tax=Nostoc favosum TaxID=2907819 RepID=UPI001E37EA71|nr:hypothetical protein [Nostoc favosum]
MATEFCHDRTLADHCIDACYSDPRPGKSQLRDGGDRQSICRATANPEESLLVGLLVDLERHGLVIPLSKKLLPSLRKYLKILLNCF